jgi:uncharacterized repeat protein (TIGR01451 family)
MAGDAPRRSHARAERTDRASLAPTCARRLRSCAVTRVAAAIAAGASLVAGVGTAAAQALPTPAGTLVRNTATVSAERAPGVVVEFRSNEVIVATVAARSRASAAFLRATPAGSGAAAPLGAAQCLDSGGQATALPPPTLFGGTVLEPGTPVAVVEERAFHGGEPVFLRIADPDRNLDARATDRVTVDVVSAGTADRERIVLAETGPDTGVFTGYVPTRVASATRGDCVLAVERARTLEMRYVDESDPADTARAEAVVDPQGTVIDSRTGAPISGARVRLVDATTGAPAEVLGDDGRSAFPSEVTSGATAVDAGGTLYRFPAGTYRFPLVARPGTYRVIVEPPPGYEFPSQATAAELQSLPGGPFQLTPASFGREYAVATPVAATFDVPVDARAGPLVVQLQAHASSAVIGDAVQYTAFVQNAGAVSLRDVRLAVTLPSGFRYAAGSARAGRDERVVDPRFEGAAQPTFAVGGLAAGSSATLRFVVRIGAGARPGDAVATAQAHALRATSNEASATVRLVDELFRSRGTIVGRLTSGDCGEAGGSGVAGVRLYLEDGRYVLTDEGGRYHFDDVAPGTHVVQLDAPTLPEGAEALGCADAASAREPRTRVVDLRPGGLQRADFRVRRQASPSASSPVADPATDARRVARTASPEFVAMEPMPPVESLAAGRGWVLPSEEFAPPIPALHVAVKHAPGDTVQLTVNGTAVNAATRERTESNATRTLAVSRWRGVPLVEGENVLVASILDPGGRETARLERAVHYGGVPVRAELDAAASTLLADGRTRPVIAVRLYDRHGRPARPGLAGTYVVEPPHRAWSEVQALRDNPLTATAPREPAWTVDATGRVRLELEPTSRAGAAAVKLNFGRTGAEEVRAWLAPAARDWVLVGLASGTVGWQRVNAHAEPLAPDAPRDGFEQDGRTAFFAKGRIRGEWLLTLSYDSARRGTVERERALGEVDPDEYYTLYGDASESGDDAPTRRKVYVKLERGEASALFGDFDTGYTLTELARYSRVLNGARVEGGRGPWRASAFAARGSEAAGRDVFQGDGTSGPYRLQQRGIVTGSERVRIEVRDRFRSEVVVETRTLQRGLDYDLDPVAGTVDFRRPVPSRSEGFDPVYVVVEYETAGAGDEATTAGGRATWRSREDAFEAGTTYVREGATAGARTLAGVDARARWGTGTEFRVEAARTTSADPTRPADGRAYLAEFEHVASSAEARAYVREQQAGYGLGQQVATEAGTRKYGAEGLLRLDDLWALQGQAYEQSALDDAARRRLAEAELRYTGLRQTAGLGLRSVTDRYAGEIGRSDQAYALATHDLYGGRVALKAGAEVALGGRDASADFPDVGRIGADWRMLPDYTLFAEHERGRGASSAYDLTRIGVRAQPWTGGQLETALNGAATENGSRLYSSLGVTQGWRRGDRWTFDAGLERAASPGVSVLAGGPRASRPGPRTSGSTPAATPGLGPAGGASPDFGTAGAATAAFVGAGYRGTDWSATARLERRDTRLDERSTLRLGLYRETRAGQAFSLAVRAGESRGATGEGTDVDVRFSWAHRPDDSRWIVLDRLDLRRDSAGGAQADRVVNNLHVNLQLDPRTQLGAQLGARYARQRFDGVPYRSRSLLYGADARRDLDSRWDVGLQATVFSTPDAGTREHSFGFDVGRRFGARLWVSAGWNVAGFDDRDFSRERYTARGPYVRFRLNVDEGALRTFVQAWTPGTRR